MALHINTPINTNDQSLDRVLNTGLPIALVFHNGDLKPGQEQKLGTFAEHFQGRLLIARISARDNPRAVASYAINSTPSIVTIKDRNIYSKAQSIGEAELVSHIEYLVGTGSKPARSASNTASKTTQGAGKNVTENHSRGGGSAPGSPVNLTDSEFERVVFQNTHPVLVDFWAPWCGPCRMTDPILEKIARENTGRIIIAKLNVDENPNTANKYGIHSIPTMMVVKGGKIIDRWSGVLPEPLLRQRLAHVMTV